MKCTPLLFLQHMRVNTNGHQMLDTSWLQLSAELTLEAERLFFQPRKRCAHTQTHSHMHACLALTDVNPFSKPFELVLWQL